MDLRASSQTQPDCLHGAGRVSGCPVAASGVTGSGRQKGGDPRGCCSGCPGTATPHCQSAWPEEPPTQAPPRECLPAVRGFPEPAVASPGGQGGPSGADRSPRALTPAALAAPRSDSCPWSLHPLVATGRKEPLGKRSAAMGSRALVPADIEKSDSPVPAPPGKWKRQLRRAEGPARTSE